MKKFLMLLAVASLLIASVGCKKKETIGDKLDNAAAAAEEKAAEVKKAAEKAAE